MRNHRRKIGLKTYGLKKVPKHKKNIKRAARKIKKFGDFEIVTEPSEKTLEEERQRIQKLREEDLRWVEARKLELQRRKARGTKTGLKGEKNEKNEEVESGEFDGIGIKVTKSMEKMIDEKVERMLHPKIEAQESENLFNQSKNSKNKPKEDNPKDLIDAIRDEERKRIKSKKQ